MKDKDIAIKIKSHSINTDNKIVFIDADGTLISYQGYLPETAKIAIKKAKEKGNKVILCTGRSQVQIIPEIFNIGFNGYILGNGAYIYYEDQVIFHKPINNETYLKLSKYFNENNIAYYLETNEGIYLSDGFEEKGNPAFQKYARFCNKPNADNVTVYDSINGIAHKFDPNSKINRISYILNTYDDYRNMINKFPNLNHGVWGGVSVNPIFGYVSEKGISKGDSIKFILKYTGIPIEKSYSVGDSNIDIPMFKNTGTSVCMGNGTDEAKKSATYVTDDINSNGLLKAFTILNLI